MMKIKNYNEFNNGEDILYIFDFDDTLVESPSFEELAIEYLSEQITIEELLKSSVNRIGVSLQELEWQDNRIFVNDPSRRIKEFGNWVRKGDRVYMTSPNAFCNSDLSLPTGLKEMSELYRKVENKCIVTAREESIRDKVESVLKQFGLELPRFGLHMAPVGTKDLGTWKGYKIVEIVQQTGFNKAIFYDDNPKFIKKATRVVKEKLPALDFKTLRVV